MSFSLSYTYTHIHMHIVKGHAYFDSDTSEFMN